MNNLNQYLQPLNAPVTQERPVIGMTFDTENEVQTNWRKTRLLKDVIVLSNVGTAGASLNNGDDVTFQAILTPSSIDPNMEHVAICFFEGYQGALPLAEYRIFPNKGSSITGGVYEAYGGYLYEADYPYRSSYIVYIRNISAGAVTVNATAQWKGVVDRSVSSA